MGFGLVLFSFKAISAKPQYAGCTLLQKGNSRIPRIDFEGWLLLLLAVTVPLITVTLGDNFLDWSSPMEIVLMVCSPLFICLFVLYETQAARTPIVDMTPIFKAAYLRVLFQVFGVIMILNCVGSTTPSFRIFDSNQICRSSSSFPRTRKSELSRSRPLRTGP